MSADPSESSFFFESDQLALKGCDDYQMVLSAMAKFEALRSKALADLDHLYDLKKEAQTNPLDFVRTLQNTPKKLNMPSRPKIPEVPNIDWGKYSSTPNDVSNTTRNGHGTRGRKVTVPEALIQKKANKHDDIKKEVTVIRGRVKSDQQSETFNQLWTTDEQRILEELLVEFPPERIEARRFRKIADKLGTKTLKQVASRIQKYFIRLAQCGLPVPGKVPNLAAHRRKSRHRHHLKNKAAMPSTFLQAYVPPVYMPDDEEFDSVSSVHDSIDTSDSDDSDSDLDLADEVKESEEYKELMTLKTLRQIKLTGDMVKHVGYKCDGCGQEPIIGIRYHCRDCPQENSVDFCSLCNCRRITLANHRPGHSMLPIEEPINEDEMISTTSTLLPISTAINTDMDTDNDKDYLPSKFNIPGHYNYLDPNYIPSSTP